MKKQALLMVALSVAGLATAQETVKIGHAAAITGPVAHFGKDSENGARMAIDALNARGATIGGKKVKWVLQAEDDGSDPKLGTAVAQKLVDGGVVAVVGHLNSGTTVPASKIYNSAGIPQISPAATTPLYTHQGYKTAFRIVANDDLVGRVLASYAIDTLKAKKIAMGIYTPGLDTTIGDTSGDLLVADPLVGPHGDKGTLEFLNNIMMYTHTPSQAASEAFLVYWYQHMHELWKQGVMSALPVRKSIIDLPEFQQNAQNVKIIKEWQPVAKTYAAQSTTLSALLAAIDGGQPLNTFTQTMLTGQGDSKSALAALETAIKGLKK